MSLPFIDPCDPPYNAVPDADQNGNGTDWTAAFQAALDAAKVAGGIVLPSRPGYYKVTRLHLNQSVYLHGLGCGFPSTTLVQPNGVNGPLVTNAPALNGLPYLHWSGVKDIRLIKAFGSTDTLGSGIEMNCRTGEGFYLEHLQVGGNGYGFPESGICVKRGGAPGLRVRDVHLFVNGQYGLDVQRTSGDTWQTVRLDGVSGDWNKNALIRIKTAGGPFEQFFLSDIKAESKHSIGKQPYVVELDMLNGRPVFIDNLSALNTGATNAPALVLIKNQNARVVMRGFTGQGFTNIIEDQWFNRPASVYWTKDDPHDLMLFWSFGQGHSIREYEALKLRGAQKLLHSSSRPVITGSRSDGTALANMLAKLAGLGLITDQSSP